MNHSLAAIFLASTAAVGVAIGAEVGLSRHFSNSAATGAEYLRDQGYSDVTGGERVFLTSCGKGAVAREYNAKDVNGQDVTKTVCGRLFWRHAPLLESHQQPPKMTR